jgi:hypothetical protein
MSKYNSLKFLKITKTRINHRCDKYERVINHDSFYYAEEIKDESL